MAVKFEAGLIVLSIFVSFSLASYIRNRRNYDFYIFPKIFVTQLFCWFVDVTESLGLNRPNYRSVDPWAKYNWTYLIIVFNRPIVGVMIFSSGLIFVCQWFYYFIETFFINKFWLLSMINWSMMFRWIWFWNFTENQCQIKRLFWNHGSTDPSPEALECQDVAEKNLSQI